MNELETLNQPHAERIDIPDPPAGYSSPHHFTYPRTGLVLSSLIAFFLLLPLLGGLTWQLQGRPEIIGGHVGFADILVLLGITALTVVVHELLHGIVLWRLGYRVQFGADWRMAGVYTAALGQFISRRDNLLVAAAPLVGLTILLVPLLALPSPMVVMSAFAALLINTSAAVGDIYLIWKLTRMPSATLLYDASAEEMLVYLPAT